MLEAESSTSSPDVKRGLELFRVRPPENAGQPRSSCGGCGRPIWSDGGYRMPGITGIYCAFDCIETRLFGQGRCRWCGAEMSNPYPKDGTVECRLCSTDCRANYRAFVLGDCSARLGSGKRLLAYLQKRQPAIYRQLVAGAGGPTARYCHNPRCPNGENGRPTSLAHLRADARYCGPTCKKAAQRSPNREKQASNRQCLCGSKGGQVGPPRMLAQPDYPGQRSSHVNGGWQNG